MITDRIGRNEVLLPINHNYNKICDVFSPLENKNKKTKSSLACVMARAIQSLHRHDAYCPIALSN